MTEKIPENNEEENKQIDENSPTEKTIEEIGWELFHMILEVASGKKQVACDKLGLHNDLVLFNPGPVT